MLPLLQLPLLTGLLGWRMGGLSTSIHAPVLVAAFGLLVCACAHLFGAPLAAGDLRPCEQNDNPKKRKYEPGMLSISCKRDKSKAATVRLPRSFRLPDGKAIERFRRRASRH